MERLLDSKLFSVTVLTRDGSQQRGFPTGVTVKQVDYDSVESLEEALRGQDALVSAMAFEAIDAQKNLVDAAANAGIKRMIPSEYGNDLMNPKLAAFPSTNPRLPFASAARRRSLKTPHSHGQPFTMLPSWAQIGLSTSSST